MMLNLLNKLIIINKWNQIVVKVWYNNKCMANKNNNMAINHNKHNIKHSRFNNL